MRVIACTMALFAAPLLAQEAGQESVAKVVFERLSAEFNQARTEAVQAAREKGEQPDLSSLSGRFLSHFRVAAKEYARTEGAVPFLTWIVMNGSVDKAAVNAAVDEILAHHVGSQQLVPMAGGVSRMGAIIGDKRVAELKSQLLAKGHPEVKGTMMFFSGYMAINARDATDESIAAAIDDLRQAAKFGGEYGSMAEGMLFERERLQIGMEAPDIVGPDIDGVEFKLSDYRGKVVVIDFWGDW